MDAGTLCLDGTTIRASNGKKGATNAELSRKILEYARMQLEAIERYLKTLDENDLHEERLDKPMVQGLDKGHLPDREELKRRIAFLEACLWELDESGRNSICSTNPEASMMPAKKGGMKACYNVQTAVDAKNHMIADFEVTSNPSDRGTLNLSMERFKGAGPGDGAGNRGQGLPGCRRRSTAYATAAGTPAAPVRTAARTPGERSRWTSATTVCMCR